MKRYVAWVQSHEEISREIGEEFPRAIFFMGRLIFEKENWLHRVLHNQTPYPADPGAGGVTSFPSEDRAAAGQ